MLRDVIAAALIGVLAALAVAVGSGWRPDTHGLGARRGSRPSKLGARITLAAVGFLAGWAASGWPAAGIWLAALGWAVPSVVAADRSRRAELDRLESRASWVSLVRGQLAGGSSLAAALEAACDRATGTLSAELEPLRRALAVRTVPEAIAAWRAQQAGTAGELGAVLAVVAVGQGGRMADLLAQAADSLRSRAQAGRRLERERTRLRVAARAITGLVVLWVVAGGRLDPSLFGPTYNSPAGQVLLFFVLGLLGGALVWLNRMDRALEIRC
jgi:Flp pilus assembly protein TadB